jgi:hypothetical protein
MDGERLVIRVVWFRGASLALTRSLAWSSPCSSTARVLWVIKLRLCAADEDVVQGHVDWREGMLVFLFVCSFVRPMGGV